ncbi:ABC-2 type transport system permease protein [Herbihabitans rhizosphaerae]|uniref:Transport permease protein n=1 Tax=Herbihabitans rhizosphaerae TaxID=1872711 RepID=A0A4Q7KQ41_9PSEU|nr:ABC transporter permease [Herbihabitans rhizosphaerae]RZS38928.1 ABC-2 type transport system permease protein [Herbihabitans rhizosphaerae]
MTTMVTHTGYLIARALRALLRQPVFIVITLVQPMIWLLLFGQLFKRVVEIPGFTGGSYIDFLTPGVVVMTVLFSAGWAGMAFIEDMDRGVMDRMLSSPVSRAALMAAGSADAAVSTIVQSIIIVLVGLAVGASFSGGVLGVLIMLLAAVLLAVAFSSLSNGVALLVRTRESLIGFSMMLTLPLSFLSSAMMAKETSPEWVRTVSGFNPVDWAVVASRSALSADPDWGAILSRLGGLLAVALIMGWLATRAFRSYQRSV